MDTKNKKAKIAIIDDDKGAGLLLKEVIEQAGPYEVVTTTSSWTAEVFCKIEKPEIIILDNVMPHIKGSELVKKLHRNPKTKNIPLIMVTGKGELVFSEEKGAFDWKPNTKEVYERGELAEQKNPRSIEKAYGVDAYFAKPAPADRLLKCIKVLLTRKRKKDDLDEWKKFNI